MNSVLFNRYLKKPLLIGLGLVFGLGVFFGLESVAGYWLNKTGYFTALPPNFTKVFDTAEFKITAKTSSQGLRDNEYQIEKPVGFKRVLAVGDSFTFGWGVESEKSWVSLLEDDLNRSGEKVELINGGIPGASPTDIRHVCRAYSDRLDVDAIILTIYSDDLYQVAARDEQMGTISKFVTMNFSVLSRLNTPVISQLNAAQAKLSSEINTSVSWKEQVQDSLRRNPRILLNLDPKIRKLYMDGKINPALANTAASAPDFFTYVYKKEMFEYALNSLEKRLDLFKQRCSKGKPVIVFLIPSAPYISTAYHPAVEQFGYQMDEKLMTFDFDKYIGSMAEKRGFKYVSVQNEFRKDGCMDCYFHLDEHFTEQGNKRAKDVLAPKIAELVREL